jgi:hypothetical protein
MDRKVRRCVLGVRLAGLPAIVLMGRLHDGKAATRLRPAWLETALS